MKWTKGITLIEIMIIVAIIGIAVSIAIPAFTDYKEVTQSQETIQYEGSN